MKKVLLSKTMQLLLFVSLCFCYYVSNIDLLLANVFYLVCRLLFEEKASTIGSDGIARRFILHIEEDRVNLGSLIFTDEFFVKVLMENSAVELAGNHQVHGSTCNNYHRDGPGSNVIFYKPTSFVQTPEYLLITDEKHHCIRKLNRTNNYVSEIAGRCSRTRSSARDGKGTRAGFRNPNDIIQHRRKTDWYLISDRFNKAIRLFDYSTRKVSTLFNNRRYAIFPKFLLWDSPTEDNIIIGTKNRVVRWTVNDTSHVTLAGTDFNGDTDGPTSQAKFKYIHNIVRIHPSIYLVSTQTSLRILDLHQNKVSTLRRDKTSVLLNINGTVYAGIENGLIPITGNKLEYNDK